MVRNLFGELLYERALHVYVVCNHPWLKIKMTKTLTAMLDDRNSKAWDNSFVNGLQPGSDDAAILQRSIVHCSSHCTTPAQQVFSQPVCTAIN